MYLANYSESSKWIELLSTYVCYVGEVTVSKYSGWDIFYDQSSPGTHIATFHRPFDGKTLPTRIGGYYTVKYELDDNKIIYFFNTDPGYSKT